MRIQQQNSLLSTSEDTINESVASSNFESAYGGLVNAIIVIDAITGESELGASGFYVGFCTPLPLRHLAYLYREFSEGESNLA